MAIIPVVCTKCRKEFSCDTEKGRSEGYRSASSPRIILQRCDHCGQCNRIEIPAPGR